MLRHLFELGIDNLITFEPTTGGSPTPCPPGHGEHLHAYQIIEALIQSTPDLRLDTDHFMVVSPDETAISRAMYYDRCWKSSWASSTQARLPPDGRRAQPGGRQAFLGEDVTGRDILLVDDMIVTGESMLRVAYDLKARGAQPHLLRRQLRPVQLRTGAGPPGPRRGHPRPGVRHQLDLPHAGAAVRALVYRSQHVPFCRPADRRHQPRRLAVQADDPGRKRSRS